MKYFLPLVIGCFFIMPGLAQNSTFNKGDKVVNFGIGFGTGLYLNMNYITTIPTISAVFEVCVKDGVIEKGTIGVGGYIGYMSHKQESAGGGYKYNDLLIGARGTFHYPLVNKLDTYTGVTLGYDFNNNTPFGHPSAVNYEPYRGVFFAWFVGGRYYFSNSLAGMAELGVGIVYLNLGVTLKF